MAPGNSGTSSESSSDTESEAGRSANASVVCPNLAVLTAQHLQPLIEEPDWHNTNGPDFHQRNVERHYHFDTWQNGVPRSFSAAKSDTSSMAVSIHSRSTTINSSAASVYSRSTYEPSLVSNSTAKSSSFASSDRRDSVHQHYVLNDDDGGVPQLPEGHGDGRLACCFRFLACEYRSDDLDQWETHCQSHFLGCLPSAVSCPFHCNWTKSAATGEQAQQERKIHIWSWHYSHGEVDTERAPELSLLRHLWRNGIIETAAYQELRANGRLTGTQVFMRPAGNITENRRERRR